MAFSPLFQRPFSATFDRRAAAAAAWWLSGGIAAANAVAVYQPKGAASLAASYVNLANPGTYDAVPEVAPTWASATGWTIDGATQYLSIAGLQPSNSQTWSALCRFSNASGNDAVAFGSFVASSRAFVLQPRADSGGKRAYYNGSVLALAGAQTSGVVGIAGNKAYLNGVAEPGSMAAWGGASAATQTIGGYYNGSAHVPLFAGKIQAVAIYNTTLTSPQMAAVSAAMAAL